MKKNKLSELSISKKLLILNIILFSIAIVSVSEVVIKIATSNNTISNIVSSGDAIYAALNPGFTLGNSNNDSYIKRLGKYYDVNIVITDQDGYVKFKSDKVTDEKMDLETIEYNRRYKTGDEVDPFFMHYILKDGEERYILLVYKETHVKSLLWKYILSVLIPVIGVFILEYLISKRKLKDLTYICDGVIKMSKGDLDYKLEKKSNDEFGVLVDEINKMASKLKSKMDNEANVYKFKNNLITNISHDLRTPLTSLIGYIELAGNSDIDKESKDEYVKKALGKAERIKTLISELFQYSKLESGEVELQKYNINIVEMLEQCIGEYSSLAVQNNLSIIKKYKNVQVISCVDGELMIRVFENVLGNAIKYSKDNTNIYVDIVEEAEGVIISFENTSAAKLNSDINRLFERFYRADESRNQEISGSGLGLFIAQSIVSLHNGEIWIEAHDQQFKIYISLQN